MRHLNREVWLESLKKLPARATQLTEPAYTRTGDPEKNVFSPEVGLIQSWTRFSEALENRFDAVDAEYLHLLRGLWDNGELFENTSLSSEFAGGERLYFRTDQLHLASDSVLAWD